MSLCDVVESSIDSSVLSSNYAALSPSDNALLDGPDPEVPDSLPKIPKVEVNPFSPDPFKMDVPFIAISSRARSSTGNQSFASWTNFNPFMPRIQKMVRFS